MKTLLYGGTFDPPHNGHMNNLRAALALVQPDRALVMPAGTPPHKHASEPAARRIVRASTAFSRNHAACSTVRTLPSAACLMPPPEKAGTV